MAGLALDTTRNRLLDRRARLVATIHQVSDDIHLRELLDQLDAALDRVSTGTYGICETCHKPIEVSRLQVDPLACSCSAHITSEERKRVAEDYRLFADGASGTGITLSDEAAPTSAPLGFPVGGFWQRVVDAVNAARRVFHGETDHGTNLDKDLSQAWNVQTQLLPQRGLCLHSWHTYFDYLPAGKIGGDYCDLVKSDTTGDLFFLLGDAVGKGIAASMIASQLYAVFRTLLSVELQEMFERANRIFCERMATDYYATVICGGVSSTGALELVNAGHLPLLILRSGESIPLAATGVPLGLFYTSTYGVTKIQLTPGETLVCYTDGITEARNRLDVEYGPERLARYVAERSRLSPEELVRSCIADVTAFTSNAPLSDDRTLMALRHV